MNKLLSLLIILLIAITIYVVLIWQPQTRRLHEPEKMFVPGGDFVLNSVRGRTSLADYKDKVVLIYFGYTMCPDICPTNLAIMSEALSALTAEELERVQGIFISVDPARDTLERLADYTPFFHPKILGLNGDPAILREVADNYGVKYRAVKQASATDYTVDHSSFTYVIDQNGKLRHILGHATPATEILNVIRELL